VTVSIISWLCWKERLRRPQRTW